MTGKNSWYLIREGSYSGAKNMAYDQMLFNNLKTGKGKPTLRFYTWERPTISYGLNQKNIDEIIDFEKCSRRGIDVVKRPTGGRELLHGYDLSYSVIGHAVPEMGTHFSISGRCRGIHEALIKGLISFGLPSAGFDESRAKKSGYDLKGTKPCFLSLTGSEIAYRGKKIVGSAQRKEHGVFLQHGSIQLKNGTSAIVNFLIIEDENRRKKLGEFLRNSVTSMEEILFEYREGLSVDVTGIQSCIAESFSRLFEIEFECCDLPDVE